MQKKRFPNNNQDFAKNPQGRPRLAAGMAASKALASCQARSREHVDNAAVKSLASSPRVPEPTASAFSECVLCSKESQKDNCRLWGVALKPAIFGGRPEKVPPFGFEDGTWKHIPVL